MDPVERGGGPREGLFDDRVLGKTVKGPEQVEKLLKHRKVLSADRHGKFMWVNLSGPRSQKEKVVVFHLGMSGAFVVKGGKRAEYKRYTVDASAENWPPKFAKLQLTFEDGTQIAFCNARRLGGVWFCGKSRIEEESSSVSPGGR